MSDFEKLRREATPGPWDWSHHAESHCHWIYIHQADGAEYTPESSDVASMLLSVESYANSGRQAEANARFIASIHAVDDARIAAEARVAKLEKQNDALRRNMIRYFEERNHYRNLVMELDEKLARQRRSTIKNEVLVWVAGELGWFTEEILGTLYTRIDNGEWKERVIFDLEADTPEGAWLREKVMEWLNLTHCIIIRVARDNRIPREWLWNNVEESSISDDYATRTKAILAAVQWLYDNRDEK